MSSLLSLFFRSVMSITNTPNMNLPVPGVGTEVGPDYANDVNNCFSIVDGHTHTVGNGVQITPAGINISTDLPFGDNNATGLRSARLQDQNGVLSGSSDLACLYNNGGNLYFNDGSGNQIAMTAGGGIAGSPGSIANLVSPASASYSAASKTFTWASGSSGKAAAMDSGGLTIRQTDTASAKGIDLVSPNSLGANYALTLPTGLPASTKYMSCDSGGNLGFVTADDIAAAMTSTGADAIATTIDATGANAIGVTMTSVGADAIGESMTSLGADAILTTAGTVSSFLATLTGVSGSVTGTVTTYKIGQMVTLSFPTMSGTSNSTVCTITGVPSSYWPTTNAQTVFIRIVNSAGATNLGLYKITNAGVVTIFGDAGGGGWTASGTKGLEECSITYNVAV